MRGIGRLTTLAAAAVFMVSSAMAQSDLQAQLDKALHKKNLADVHAQVNGQSAILTGSVQVFADKIEAEQKARKVHGIDAVQNDITISSVGISDAVLQKKIYQEIAIDPVNVSATAFSAISVQVQNGVVRLGGHALGPVLLQDTLGTVAATKGVRDIINQISVDPLSPMDNRIRIQAFRIIYGFPTLNKYAVDPAKPIRISVQNGNLTLYGVVDSEADKEAAGIRANTVPGVFHVTNDLQVSNGESGK